MLPYILIFGGLFGLNMVVVFNGQKRIQAMLLKESLARVQKDSELQHILLSLDGATVLFSGESIQMINRAFESVFV